MIVDVVYYTGRGKVRKENEDSLVIGDKVFNSIEMEQVVKERRSKEVFAVADGMGGYIGGAVASGIIVEELSKLTEEDIEKALNRARERMKERAKKEFLLSHMGSVVTGIQVGDKEVQIFNVGDSRTFLYRKKLLFITRDDSLVWNLLEGEYEDPGEFHEAMRKHPQKNIVTSAIMIDMKGFNLQRRNIEIKSGDRYLICSDGLWEEMSYDYIEECMGLDMESAGKGLLEKASIEGRDNISFIIVEIRDE